MSVETAMDAIREYVEACGALADAQAEADIRAAGDLWPESVQVAKTRVVAAYEALVALLPDRGAVA